MKRMLDDAAEAAQRRHEDLERALESVFGRIIVTGDTTMLTDGYGMIARYLAGEAEHMRDDMRAVFSDALRASEAKFASKTRDETRIALETHLSAAREHLHDEIALQAERDAQILRKEVTRALLEVGQVARLRGTTERQAAVLRRLGKGNTLEFFNRDRLGRKIRAGQGVRLAWRHALVFLANEIVLIGAAARGIDRLAVVKDEASGPAVQVVMSITGTGAPDYETVSATYFHPNSSAYLEPAHVHA